MEELNGNTEQIQIERNEADSRMGQEFAAIVENCKVKKTADGIKVTSPEEESMRTQVDWANYLHQIGLQYGFPYKSFEEIKKKLIEENTHRIEEIRAQLNDPNLSSAWKTAQQNTLSHFEALQIDDSYVLESFDPDLMISGDGYNEFPLKRIAPGRAPEKVVSLEQQTPYSELLKRLGFKNSRYYIDYNCTKDLSLEERRLVADLLSQEYKFHLMPKAEDLPFLIKKIHGLISQHPTFGRLITSFKFANFGLYRKILELGKSKAEESRYHGYFYEKFGDQDRVAPLVVFYPHPGYERAQELADIFKKYTGDITPSGLEPQMNDKITDLVYVANGSGADKYTYLRLQAGHAFSEEEFRESVEKGGLLDPNNLAYARGAKHIN